MGKGYISIHRQIEDNWVWFCDPFSRGQAWVDLLIIANHKPNFIMKRGIKVQILRGQTGYCLDTLCSRWKWSRGKVERFMILLEKDKQIVRQKTNITTLISIVNYEKYQFSDNANDKPSSKPNSNANGNQTVNQTVTQTETNNNVNNDNNDNNNLNKINAGGDFSPPAPPENVKGFHYLPDGRSYIDPLLFFSPNDFNGLPDDNLKSVVSFFEATKNISLDPERIKKVWSVFKTQELTEQKPYRNKDDVYRHFLNWVKKQSFVTGKQKTEKKKSVAQNTKKIGVSFLDDFKFCEMDDGSIIELTKNEQDSARYDLISAKNIIR